MFWFIACMWLVVGIAIVAWYDTMIMENPKIDPGWQPMKEARFILVLLWPIVLFVGISEAIKQRSSCPTCGKKHSCKADNNVLL